MIKLNSTDRFTGHVGVGLETGLANNKHTLARAGTVNKLDIQQKHAKRNNVVPFSSKSPDRQLFEYFVADLSNVSMHFSVAIQESLTKQLKEMLNEENWDSEDTLPLRASFVTLLRFLSVAKIHRPPSIGSNGAGSITASWFDGRDRLTLDCLDRDRVLFVLSRVAADGQTERAAGETRVTLIMEKLMPYNPGIWFN